MQEEHEKTGYIRPTDEENLSESTNEKLRAMSENPGLIVEFDPEQAELAGAFREDAMNEEDALDAMYD